ncbi:hypothetical protein [Caproicibacterium amylolyticum]|uniref:Uncharacterized protein n=1 Tax=Caproicibacterium amylolyticum TaxID=2766537 RepID=A0A7G9WID0_9FIRM|nr:hypothetical protein [Caproicibacterium amylolyticum]QNO18442.1 hypothetical protein H6X83_01965 [Caproicibacterium amylolyticum]
MARFKISKAKEKGFLNHTFVEWELHMNVVIKTIMELLPAIILLIAFLLVEHFFKLKERVYHKLKKKYYILAISLLVVLIIVFSIIDKDNNMQFMYLYVVSAACLSAAPEKRGK